MKDPLEKISAIATIIGAIAIPFVIHFGQGMTERQNRKVGIAQIFTEQAEEECPHRLSTSRLIDQLFKNDLDNSDDIAINQYLGDCQTQDDAVQTEVEAEIAQREANVIAPDNSTSLSVEEGLIDISERSVALLSDYEIEIFYLVGKSKEEAEANDIGEKLRNLGLTVTITPITEERLSTLGGLSDDQIRYEPDREAQVAVALKRLLDTNYEERKFRLQTIRGRTNNYISIFLKYNPSEA
jgi:hypothetical protein